MIVAKSVLRGLGTIESTSSLGSGRGGTLESCLAAEVGKYMAEGWSRLKERRAWDVAQVARGRGLGEQVA